MTIINPNSISGISSLTAQASEMNFYRSDGSLAGLNLNGVNFNTTSGVSTFADLKVGGTLTYEDVKNIDSIGIVTARDDIRIITDNKKLKIGAGDDLNLYHDGSKSVIADTGTGGLFVAGSSISLTDAGITETMLYAAPNGAVELYYDNSKKLETTSYGAKVTGRLAATTSLTGADSVKLILGDGDDLQLFHDGSNSYIDENGSGDLKIRTRNGNGIQLISSTSENMITCQTDGAVELYYDNALRLSTASGGVNVAGNLNMNGADSYELRLGAGNDLKLYHNGSHSFIDSTLAGAQLLIRTKESGGTTNNAAKFMPTGAVELYYDGSKKFETTSTGVTVHGDLFLDNDSTAGRDIHWDVSDNALKVKDNTNINFGDGNDLQIYHNGTNSHIENSTNSFYIKSDNFAFTAKSAFEQYITCAYNGAVQLYYDNSKKFETTSTGAKVKYALQIEEASGSEYYQFVTNGYGGLEIQNETTKVCEFTDASTLDFPDNTKIQLGTGQDLKIYHNGSHSRIDHVGTGNLYINTTSAKTAISCIANGSIDLWYDNAKRFETTSYGNASTGQVRVLNSGLANNNTTPAFSCGDAGTGIYRTGSNSLGYSANGTQKWAINSSGYLTLFDNVKLQIGSGEDLKIYHNGSHSYIWNQTGDLQVRSNSLYMCSTSGGGYLEGTSGAGVKLFYNNSKKFETTNAGGTLTGDWFMTTSGYLSFPDGVQAIFGTHDDMRIQHTTGGVNEVKADNGHLVLGTRTNHMVILGAYYNAGGGGDTVEVWGGSNMLPATNDAVDLGETNHKWDDIYATNGSIQTSDRNTKENIVDSDLGLFFINKLSPKSYKFIGKTRTHYGLIAQDVETVLDDMSIHPSNFAGFIKTDAPVQNYDQRDEVHNRIPSGKNVGDEKVAAHVDYGLRYNEFIAPLIKAVQELSAEVETLKTKVAVLESS